MNTIFLLLQVSVFHLTGLTSCFQRAKNTFMTSMKEQNEVLFYKVRENTFGF